MTRNILIFPIYKNKTFYYWEYFLITGGVSMKKIKMILYIAAVLWIGVLTQVGVRYFFQDEGRIMDAFASTNSNIIESKVELAADYGTKYLSTEDKKDLIQYLFTEIGVDHNYTITQTRGNESSQIKAEKKSKNGEVSIEIISLERQSEVAETKVKQFILVDLEIYSKSESILHYKNLLEKAVNSIGTENYQSSVKINGVYTGQLTLEEKNKITDGLLKNLQAQSVSENRKDDLFIVSGYTGLIPEYITQDGKKVNINIVLSYNETANETNICLASPILNGDY